MEELRVALPDLRSATSRVLKFAATYAEDKGLDMRTSVSEELGLWELDGIIFLEEFTKHFGIDLPERAYDYVIPPSPTTLVGKLLHATAIILLFPLFLVAYPFLLLTGKRREPIMKRIKRNAKRLTLGDLALSLAAGRFVKREEVRIKLT